MTKLEQTLKNIKPVDKTLLEKTQKRLDNLTKPLGSLGRLEETAKRGVALTGKTNPSLNNKVIFTLAGDHGVIDEGVSAYPKAVTAQMVYNFINGGAGINVLARHICARVIVADLGVAEELKNAENKIKIKKVGPGTRNFAKGPAMTKEEAVKSIEAGIELVEEQLKAGVDVIGTGEMGIGNTTAASAITSVVCGVEIDIAVGRGTGIDDKVLSKKI